jgi:hypothetical protein
MMAQSDMTMQTRRDLLLMMMPKIREDHGIPDATLMCSDDGIDFMWNGKSISVLTKSEADLLPKLSDAIKIIQRKIDHALLGIV